MNVRSHVYPCFFRTFHSACRKNSQTLFRLLKTSFYTDKIESIKWLDLVPRLRIGDCLKIHIPHSGLCDLLLSSHQTFLLEVLLRQSVFCKKHLLSWFASILRNFDLWEARKSTVLPGCHFRTESESSEVCADAGTSVSSRFSVNSSDHSGRSRNQSSEARLLSPFLNVFEFLLNRAIFLVSDPHFTLLLDMNMYLTSPAVAM